MITLALAQMVYFAALQRAVHRRRGRPAGRAARQAVRPARPGNDLTLYYVVLAIFVAGFPLIVRTVHSPFGQVLKAIKENEPRAISLGYDVDRYKLLAFVLSAALAGLAGATKTLVLGFATLTDVHWTHVRPGHPDDPGGRHGHAGRADRRRLPDRRAGKQARRPRQLAWPTSTHVEWFSTLGESVGIVTGLIFVACVLLFRRGIVGEIGALLASRAPASGAGARAGRARG